MKQQFFRRVGLEIEFPVVQIITGKGMNRAAAENLWRFFANYDQSWSTIQELVTGAITGVERKTATGFVERIDTDTGVCTVEVSLAPQRTIGLAVHASNVVIRDLQRVLNHMGYTFLCAGIQPLTWFDPRRKTPKDFYMLMPRHWNFHHWLVPTASHQASIDVTADEAVRIINMLCGFAGLFAGLTASSPIARGTIQPWKETRNWIWRERCKKISPKQAAYTSNGIPATPFADIGSYIEHCWDSSIFFLAGQKSNDYEVLRRKSFTEFILHRGPVLARHCSGKLAKIQPTRDILDRIHQYGWHAAKLHYMFDTRTELDDVRAALTQGTIGEYFEEHATHCYIENRSCGVSPEGEEGVAAALTLGLIEQLDHAEQLLQELDWNEWRHIWVTTSEHGLNVEEPKTLNIMCEFVNIAKRGLCSRGAGEEIFLEPLFDRIERRQTPADDMIRAFNVGGTKQLIKDFERSR